MAFDAVAYAVLRDAMTHRGAGRASRLPSRVCEKLFVGYLTVARRRNQLAALDARIIQRNLAAPRLTAEPPVRLGRRSDSR